MRYLGDTFNVQMVDGLDPFPIPTVRFIKVNLNEVKLHHKRGFVSSIDNAELAAVVSNMIKLPVPVNKCDVKLNNHSELIMVNLLGGTLPKGCTSLPEGFEIEWYLIASDRLFCVVHPENH